MAVTKPCNITANIYPDLLTGSCKLDELRSAYCCQNALYAGSKHHSYLSISLDDQATVWLPQRHCANPRIQKTIIPHHLRSPGCFLSTGIGSVCCYSQSHYLYQLPFTQHYMFVLQEMAVCRPIQKTAGTTSWLAMAMAVTTPTGAVIATVVGSLSTACSDVVVDSIVVERSRGVPQVISPLVKHRLNHLC